MAYYISRFYKDGIYVKDTKDNVEECLTRDQIISLANKGVKIDGVRGKGNSIEVTRSVLGSNPKVKLLYGVDADINNDGELVNLESCLGNKAPVVQLSLFCKKVGVASIECHTPIHLVLDDKITIDATACYVNKSRTLARVNSKPVYWVSSNTVFDIKNCKNKEWVFDFYIRFYLYFTNILDNTERWRTLSIMCAFDKYLDVFFRRTKKLINSYVSDVEHHLLVHGNGNNTYVMDVLANTNIKKYCVVSDFLLVSEHDVYINKSLQSSGYSLRFALDFINEVDGRMVHNCTLSGIYTTMEFFFAESNTNAKRRYASLVAYI